MMHRVRLWKPVLTAATAKRQQQSLLSSTLRLPILYRLQQQRAFSCSSFYCQKQQDTDTTISTSQSINKDKDESNVQKDQEEEEELESIDPKEYPELYPELEDGQGEEEVVDTEWFVDTKYEQENQFVPLWQRQADAQQQQHLHDRQALQQLTDELLKDGTLTPEMIQQVLEQAKMDNVLVMDVRDKCDWTDYMIIADSAKGDKFLSGVAEHVGATVRKAIASHPKALADLPTPHIEGRYDQSGWLLIDLGRCIVHLFTPELRDHYDLEGLWKSVPTDPTLPMPGLDN